MAIRLREPSRRHLDQLRTSLADRAVTYPEVGATGRVTLPAGYRHDRRSVLLGGGDETWTQARRALVEWKAHAGAGVAVTPERAPLWPGTVVTATVRIGLLWVIAPSRIVYVTDTPDRFGFAYGTLPGHPERGEEAFHVMRDEDAVRFEIIAFSATADRLARLAGPISSALQRQATLRYLDAVRKFVAASTRT